MGWKDAPLASSSSGTGWQAAPIDGELSVSGGTMEPVPAWATKHPELYGLYGAGKEVGKVGLEMLGTTAGAVGGGVMGGIPGALAGAGMGYAGVKMAEDKFGGNPDARFKPEDLLTGAAMELLPRGISKAGRWVKSKFIPSKEDFALAKIYDKYGITHTLPSQTKAHPSKTLSIMESVLGYSPLSGDVMMKNSMNQLSELNAAREKLVNLGASEKQLEKVGNAIRKEATAIIEKHEGRATERSKILVDEYLAQTTKNQTRYGAGSTVREMLGSNLTKAQDDIEARYTAVRSMLGKNAEKPIPVSKETMSAADMLFKEEMAIAPEYRNNVLLRKIRPFISDNMLKGLDQKTLGYLNSNPKLKQAYLESGAGEEGSMGFTWDALKDMRSRLLTSSRQIYKSNPKGNSTTRVYSILSEAIDNDMAKFADQIPGVQQTYNAARSASKQMHEIYDKDILGIMNAKPQDVVKRITTDVGLLSKVKTTLGDDAVQQLKSVWLRDAFDKSIDSAGRFSPIKLNQSMKAIAPEARSMLMTSADEAQLAKVSKEINTINTKYFGKTREKCLDFLSTVAGTSNEAVFSMIFRPEIAADSARNIAMAKRLLTPDRVKDIQELALRKVLTVNASGHYLPVKASNLWSQYDAPLKHLLPKSVYDDTKTFVFATQNMKRVEALANNASQTAQVLVGLNALQSVGNAVSSPQAALGAVKTLGLPWAIAKIYMSDTARNFLKKALIPKNPQATADFMRALEIGIANKATTDQK